MNKIIATVLTILISPILGYLIATFIISPNIESKKIAKKTATYTITHYDAHGWAKELSCDSFEFKSPYWVEYYYKGQKLVLSSKSTIAVETNED